MYLFHAAAGEKRGSAPMYICNDGSSIVDNVHNLKGEGSTEIVQIVSIDDIVKEPYISYFKVDVQGFEYFVFQGAKKLFKDQK